MNEIVFSTYVEMIPEWLHHLRKHGSVFSTYVEMILYLKIKKQSYGSILHVCGDDPIFQDKETKLW